MPKGGMRVKLLLLLKLLLEGLEDEQSNDSDESQSQALQRCRVRKPKTNEKGDYMSQLIEYKVTVTFMATNYEDAENFVYGMSGSDWMEHLETTSGLDVEETKEVFDA